MLIIFQGFQLIYVNKTAMVHMWWTRSSDCYYSWWWDCQIEKIQRCGGGGGWALDVLAMEVLGYVGFEREREWERWIKHRYLSLA